MARERPTASDVHHNHLAQYGQYAALPFGIHAEPEEAADIVLRAGRLGFSPWRVATALSVPPDELARIEQLLPQADTPR